MDPRAGAQSGLALCFWLSSRSAETHEGGPAGDIQVTVLFFLCSHRDAVGKRCVLIVESSLCSLLEAVAANLCDLYSVPRDYACRFLMLLEFSLAVYSS